MTEKETRERFRDVFLKEWRLYVEEDVSSSEDEQAATPEVSYGKRSSEFDPNPQAGELRLFAWDGSSLPALLYKEMYDSWIVLPVSEFTVPATEQEILIGKRVYQLWNSFTAPKAFAEKSWLVDSLPKQDMADLCEALLHVLVEDPIRDDLKALIGLPITSVEDPRLDYEREFAAGPIVQKLQLDIQEKTSEAVGRLRLSREFFLKTIKKLIPERYAAATGEDSSFMLILEGTSEEDIRKACVECDLVSSFKSIIPDDDPYTYVFRPKSLPNGWGNAGDIPVQARNRKTLERIGEGVLEAKSGEIVIRTTGKVKDAIEKPEQLVLVMSRQET
jgi:hypothetical protein